MRDRFLYAPTETVQAGIARTKRYLALHDSVSCSISGGADSDCMLDLVCSLDIEHKVDYYFFNTGLEMQATLRHIDFLQNKYDVKITEIRPKHPIPSAVKKYGLPFLSKRVSEYMNRLQKHGFQWEDKSFSELYEQYPKCKAALRWWCNDFGGAGRMDIASIKYLKEYIIANPPQFEISPHCCDCAKKQPAAMAAAGHDISFIGVRKAEGGVRATTYKSCFADTKFGKKHFPLFWWQDSDRQAYEEEFGIVHSDAYTHYGCKRTGCAACPFGSRFRAELEMLDRHEPKLAVAARNIFGKSHDYTQGFYDFRNKMKGR